MQEQIANAIHSFAACRPLYKPLHFANTFEMTGYRYILEPYKGIKTRHFCPNCQQSKRTFSLYIDTVTGKSIHPQVGRCNRESKCGYNYTPKDFFQDNGISGDMLQGNTQKIKTTAPQSKPTSFISKELFLASLKGYESNQFTKFLISLFGVEVSNRLISKYFIGTSKKWSGATVFWQIDSRGKIRTGKIMLYNGESGKRIKVPYNHISWVHTVIKQTDYQLKQCLFGEHLLVDKSMPVAIVESEKTAIIASVYLPQFIWLAAGSLTNLNAEKCKVLQGRIVALFPDLNGFKKWSVKAMELSHIASFTVSDLLERKASKLEKEQGYDLADYLIRFESEKFNESVF